MGSRIYHGLWRVKVTYTRKEDPGVVWWDLTDPDIYEVCETLCMMFGAGFPYNEAGYGLAPILRDVKSAMIVPETYSG